MYPWDFVWCWLRQVCQACSFDFFEYWNGQNDVCVTLEPDFFVQKIVPEQSFFTLFANYLLSICRQWETSGNEYFHFWLQLGIFECSKYPIDGRTKFWFNCSVGEWILRSSVFFRVGAWVLENHGRIFDWLNEWFWQKWLTKRRRESWIFVTI